VNLSTLAAGIAFASALFSLEPNVVIHHTTPAAIVAALRQELEPQGFVMGDITDKEAVFSFDKGLVAQATGGFLHLFMDLHTRFKTTADGVQVIAFQELRGNTSKNASFDFRRPVRDSQAMEKLQRLLELVRDKLETAASDSVLAQ
jgi:hypothetical protein